MKRINFITLIASLFLIACTSVNFQEVKNQRWKNSGGAYLGDIIVFEDKNGEGYFIDSTFNVFKDGKIIGKVIKGNSKKMIIKTPEKGESEYVNF